MDGWTPLGTVASLQIHRGLVLTGRSGERNYDPSQLVWTEELAVGPGGASGIVDGGWMLDVHHVGHPANTHPNPERTLSVGFTGHYRLIADHFGDVKLGVAGENVIVASDRRVLEDEIAGGIRIETADGVLEIPGPKPAQPCRPFTRLLLEDDTAGDSEVDVHRTFLRDGIRGFVAGTGTIAGVLVIRPGDPVMARR